MPEKTDNLIYQRTSTTGIGSLTLENVTGWRTFYESFGTDTVFRYVIRHPDKNEWEIGEGTLSDSTTLNRDTIIRSSNTGNKVDFSSGTKEIVCDIDNDYFDTAVQETHEQQILHDFGNWN